MLFTNVISINLIFLKKDGTGTHQGEEQKHSIYIFVEATML